MLTVLGMFVLLLSVLVGVRTGGEAAEQGRATEHERVRVEAEVLHEAVVPDQDSDADLDWVSVRYTDGAGRVHEAEVPATGPPSAGTTVPMWVDRAGRPAAAPPGALEAVVLGAVVGLGIAAAGGLLLIVDGTTACRRCAERHGLGARVGDRRAGVERPTRVTAPTTAEPGRRVVAQEKATADYVTGSWP